MMDADQSKMLREPFPREAVGLLPRAMKRESPKGKCAECGGWHGLPAIHLDYVGHAAVTDRLLRVDPAWTWEPVAFDAAGLPALDANGGLWIRLTGAGVTRLRYRHADGKRGGDAIKETIGDALRNAAMRFGVALDLWSKEELQPGVEKASAEPHDEPQRPPEPSPLDIQKARVWRLAKRRWGEANARDSLTDYASDHDIDLADPAALQRLADQWEQEASAPRADPPPLAERPITDAQLRKLHATLGDLGITDREERLETVAATIGVTVASTKDLTVRQAGDLIDKLEALAKEAK